MIGFAGWTELREFAKGVSAPPLAAVINMSERLKENVKKHPALKQWAIRMADAPRVGGAGETSMRNTEPWMALGEKLFAVLSVLMGALKFQRQPDHTPQHQAFSFAMRLLMSDTYLWTSKISDIVSASPLPAHVTGRELLAAPVMFWSDESARAIVGLSASDSNWSMVSDAMNGIHVARDLTRVDGSGGEISEGMIPYGHRFPADFDAQAAPAALQILQRLAFLKSPFVERKDDHLPRAWRREMERNGVPKEETEEPISVVVLRRDVAEALASSEGRSVEWKHQWWVSGHYRAQWYPSKNAHEVIWIAPHLKGPADAPMAERIYKVSQ